MSQKIDESQEMLLEADDYTAEEPDQERDFEVPSKDRKLVTHPYDFIIRSLTDQVKDETLLLDDKFQRRRVWDDSRSSRLIESLLLNVPIPVCYFAEIDNGSYSVVDGKQRLTAIYRFLDNQYDLKGLKVRPELIGKRFFQLDVVDQRSIRSRTLRCIVLLKESHPDIRYDVFERINTGSTKLNTQELRNSIYRGYLNDLILDLSENVEFKRMRLGLAMDQQPSATRPLEVDKRMQDCELILRFFAFFYNAQHYKGALAPFLDDYLNKGAKFGAETLMQHRNLFEKTITNVYLVFSKHSFRRYLGNDAWENQINRAIFDVIMLSFAHLETEVINNHKQLIFAEFKAVCGDKDFDDAITSTTKSKGRVQTRISTWFNALRGKGVNLPEIVIGQ